MLATSWWAVANAALFNSNLFWQSASKVRSAIGTELEKDLSVACVSMRCVRCSVVRVVKDIAVTEYCHEPVCLLRDCLARVVAT